MIITHGNSYQRAWESAKISRREQYLRTRTELLNDKDLYSREDIKWQLDRLELSKDQISYYLHHGIIDETIEDILLELESERHEGHKNKIDILAVG